MVEDNYARKRLTEELLRQRERDLNEQKEKYESKIEKLKEKKKSASKETRTEKAARTFVKNRIRMLQYARQIKQPLLKSRKQDLRALRLQIRLARIQAMQRNPQFAQQRMFDFIFRAGDIAAPQVERELSGMGTGSLHSEGDRTAFNIGRESMFLGNLQHVNHSFNVDKETRLFGDIIP